MYVDIDAANCGNESRFVNDYHGTGASGPNAQFWQYFDEKTGERRMAVKTIQPIPAGDEILVNYGALYFEKDSSDDSSDSEQEDAENQTRSKG